MLSILVIEKDPTIRRVCQMVLSKGGYNLQAVETLVDGLRALEQATRFSAIFLSTDLETSQITDILRGLEKRPETQNIPVIVLAAGATDFGELREQFPAVLSVLYKPLTPALILQSLNQALKIGEVPFIQARRETLKKSKPVTPEVKVLPATVEKAKKPAKTAVIALQGNIEMMPLPEILQLLQFQKHTGCLRVVSDLREVRVFLSHGQIQWAVSRNFKKEFRLGRLLVISRSIEPERLREALVKKNGNKSPLGQYLIQGAFIDGEKLQTALKEQTCQIIYEILRWKNGLFAFEILQELPNMAKETQLNLSIEGLIMEGCRRMDEWNHLVHQLGAANFTIRKNGKIEINEEKLSPAEKMILSLTAEPVAIEELGEKLFLPSLDLYKTCHRLIQQELLLKSLPA